MKRRGNKLTWNAEARNHVMLGICLVWTHENNFNGDTSAIPRKSITEKTLR